ncbi:MAG: ADP-forming succinate--CoA ligase subunit beta [Anaerolineales bacterium]|nr:ADP-forming succinate--CoA ligase subunit beta [Anaerolineales bacterium]MCW5855032.1 ADP-forming succinate--CoA ligase subunit beta [Anaerolineales bacterium]
MKLHEYISKDIFAKYGVPVPKGEIAATPEEAGKIAEKLGGRVVVKAQVLVGGRGKAGGVKLAATPQEAVEAAKAILGMDIKGLTVSKVLIAPAVEIATEIYLGITNDRTARQPVIIASAAGGVDIEEVAKTNPEKIIRVHVNPLLGVQDYNIRDLAIGIELDRSLWDSFHTITKGLWEAYHNSDATLAEINPLVIDDKGQLLGIDGKMVIDDSALYRHPDFEELRDLSAEEPAEIEARESDLTYIKLDGEIGCMVNGAGLAMATMDIIKLFGGEPANFLDIGGGANAEKVAAALRIILSDTNVKAVLFNIFGGITRGDEVAKGILEAMDALKPTVPMVIRLVGTNAAEGRALLAEANMITAETLAEAAQKAVEAAKGSK